MAVHAIQLMAQTNLPANLKAVLVSVLGMTLLAMGEAILPLAQVSIIKTMEQGQNYRLKVNKRVQGQPPPVLLLMRTKVDVMTKTVAERGLLILALALMGMKVYVMESLVVGLGWVTFAVVTIQ
jgi:hypothetical protein